MKTCSILISNYNSFEAIQLCLESIHRYTDYPYYLIVYDDCSTNNVDLEYLRDQRNIGWIELIEGEKRVNHGGALNALLRDCNTDIAIILDNDIQILKSGWLEDAVKLVKDDTLLICGIEHDYKSGKPSYPDWFQTWFMMINMEAYRDGMEVDWSRVTEDEIMIPVGAKLHIKIKENNPKGYKFITPIPDYIQGKYRHFAHVSSIATHHLSETPEFTKARESKLGEIRHELNKLRGGKYAPSQ